MSGLPDRSLLDRLNALKPSSISLDASRQTSAFGTIPSNPGASTKEDSSSALFVSGTAAAEPVSREDALAARLKTLRHERDATNTSSSSGEPAATPSNEIADVKEPDSAVPGKATKNDLEQIQVGDEDDPLYFIDDQAVNDLLLELAEEGLGDEDGDDDDDDNNNNINAEDDGYEILPLPEVPKSLGEDSDDGDDAEHSQKVEDLLKSLAGTKIVDSDDGDDDRRKDGDSDDSDGEVMDREIRRVLAQAQDEAELAKQAGIDDDDDHDDHDDKAPPPRRADNDKEDSFLGLPTVPTELADPPPTDDPSSDPMGLPSVPTRELPKRGDDDDISARLAALRGLQGKAAGLGQTDAFGLPSAPTFRPGAEEGGVLKRGHFGHGRRNYTDDDTKAWCIVCLEDATVRCLGCADGGDGDEADQNNAYCTRCWQDMHVGPAAGFDERGHKRVPLVR